MEKDIVYIAGDPHAYPMEYYDTDAKCFQGVVPELLRQFSEQSRYDVRYYAPGQKDQREQLAQNQQVDVVSCSEEEECFSGQTGEDVLVLETGQGEEVFAYHLCLLDVAPEGLAEDLRNYLSGVSQGEVANLLVQTAQQEDPYSHALAQNIILGLVLAVLFLTAGIILVARRGRRKLKKLQRSKEVDPVTGIGNRAYLERCCRTYLNDGNRVLYTMFCFCFDPEGPDGGDAAAFPRLMAAVLNNCASDTDILARVSDGGFALLRLSSGERESVEWLTSALGRIREAADQDKESPSRRVAVGVCPLKMDDRDLDEVILRGLHSAQAARRAGLDYQFFNQKTVRALREERQIRADVRHALENRELQLYLQFYADARTGRVAGAEAIPFWEHLDRGPLLLEYDRDILEREGLASQLDDYMLERACAFLDTLKQSGREDFFLLYRLSKGTAYSENWVERCRELIGDCRQLALGVVRSAAPKDREMAIRNLHAVRELGVQLVLDGFDGRLDDLFQAQEAQFSGLKLNRSLVGRLGTPSGRTVLEAVLRTGHELGFTVFAEAVETEEQSACLRELGCDLLRGKLYAHPLPAWEAGKKLSVRGGGAGRG